MGEDSGWGERRLRRSTIWLWLALGIVPLMGSTIGIMIAIQLFHHVVSDDQAMEARQAEHSGLDGNPEVSSPHVVKDAPVTVTQAKTSEEKQDEHPKEPSPDEKSEAAPEDKVQQREVNQTENAEAANTGEKAYTDEKGEASAPVETNETPPSSPAASDQPLEGKHGVTPAQQAPTKQQPDAGSAQKKQSGQKQQENSKSGKPDAVPAVGTPSQKQLTIAQLPAVVKRMPAKELAVYLTFDDGPTRYLQEMVKILIEKQAPATFFWIGVYSPPAPELLKQMQRSNIQFGTHTMRHQRLSSLSYQAQRKEIEQGMAVLSSWIGSQVRYVRPPYGARDHNTDRVASELGLKTILWSVDPRDWEKGATPEKIIQRVTSQLHPGAVILLHEKPATLQALPQLIDHIRDQGYQLAGLPAQ